jgi:hypothetical protein
MTASDARAEGAKIDTRADRAKVDTRVHTAKIDTRVHTTKIDTRVHATKIDPRVDEALVDARIAQLVAAGARATSRLGEALSDGEGVLEQFEAIGHRTAELRQVAEELVPRIADLRAGLGTRSPWDWFTGRALERRVLHAANCDAIRELALHGAEASIALEATRGEAVRARRALVAQMRALAVDLAAAKRLLGSTGPAQAFRKALDAEALDRFGRRAANLEATLTALELTHEQYRVADRSAQAILDRFAEIRAVLLPLWRQRTGMELVAAAEAPAD